MKNIAVSKSSFYTQPHIASSPVPAPTALSTLPVLSSTHLCLELMVHSGPLDLRAAVTLVRRDPVAALRLFGLAAREFPDPEGRPERLEDCLGSLPGQELLDGLYSPPSLRREQAAMIPFARHAYAIACHAGLAATSLGLNREEAHLVGLLHAIGTLPGELRRSGASLDAAATMFWLDAICNEFRLPLALQYALQAVHREERDSVWLALVDAAHDLEANSLHHACSHKSFDGTPF